MVIDSIIEGSLLFSYPILKSDSSITILFSAVGEGMVVQVTEEDSPYYVGFFSTEWDERSYIILCPNVEIKLSNKG